MVAVRKTRARKDLKYCIKINSKINLKESTEKCIHAKKIDLYSFFLITEYF